jgi:alkylation response protein AidB-like acyl-CoA dehydrogenase
MVGSSLGCYQHIMPYLFERKQFGTRVGDFQAVQHQYAQVCTSGSTSTCRCVLKGYEYAQAGVRPSQKWPPAAVGTLEEPCLAHALIACPWCAKPWVISRACSSTSVCVCVLAKCVCLDCTER